MDLLKIQVPFIDREEIKNRADGFRALWWGESLPVDVENIIEIKLKISLIPTPNLRESCDIDAVSSANLKTIHVDHDMFVDDRQKNRLRFSLAHELGHYVLHKNIYNQIKINNLYKFPEAMLNQMSGEHYNYLEIQANRFASCLLVPRERLKIERAKLIDSLKGDSEFTKLSDSKTQNSYLALHLAKIFGVSSEVMEIALSDN